MNDPAMFKQPTNIELSEEEMREINAGALMDLHSFTNSAVKRLDGTPSYYVPDHRPSERITTKSKQIASQP